LSLPYTANNPDILVGRHAIAIDERQGFFPPNLWWLGPNQAKAGPKDLLQAWFPGSHSDVGGGYPEAESAQPTFALEWMLVESANKGLLLDRDAADRVLGKVPRSGLVSPADDKPVHESLTYGWWLTEIVPKPAMTEPQPTRRIV
jgi:uncharacterized protein (DUF2235 family)